MSKSRRQFLVNAALAYFGASLIPSVHAQQTTEPPPGMPPAFGTAPPVGPEVAPTTFAEAEKLMQVQFTAAERAQAAGNWRSAMAPLYERRTGPRKIELESTLAPYSRWNPVLPGEAPAPTRDHFVRSNADPGSLPSRDEDIAFAPLTPLARWTERSRLSSERLTQFSASRLVM